MKHVEWESPAMPRASAPKVAETDFPQWFAQYRDDLRVEVVRGECETHLIFGRKQVDN